MGTDLAGTVFEPGSEGGKGPPGGDGGGERGHSGRAGQGPGKSSGGRCLWREAAKLESPAVGRPRVGPSRGPAFWDKVCDE